MRILESKNKYSDYKPTPWLLKPLWFAAGADPVLLRSGTYSDQVKMACLGGTVYATSLLAFFSGSYAIHTVFDDDLNGDISLMSWAIGALWALIIFNLDRFIVVSSPPNIGEEGIKKNIKKVISISFVVRIVLGGIIGMVISTPLEIKIFEKDIQKIISERSLNEYTSSRDARLVENITYNQLLEEEKKLEDDLQKSNVRIENLKNEYNEETKGTRSGTYGIGPRARDIERKQKEEENSRIEIQKKLENIKLKIKSLAEEIENEAKKNTTVITGLNSLVSKAAMPHEINPTIALFVILFLLSIELTPIILKTFLESSPYDFQKANLNDAIKDRSEKYKEMVIGMNTREFGDKNYLHERELNEKKRQFDEKLRIEKESFESKLDFLKSQMDEILKIKIEKDIAEKFNEIFSSATQKKQLDNLNEQKEYIGLLDELQIDDAKRKLTKDTELEHTALKRKLIEEERNVIRDVEMTKLQKIKEKKLNDMESEFSKNPNKEYKDLKSKNIQEPNKEDDLIEGKVWKAGDDYKYVKILSKNNILEIVKDEEKAKMWYNSEDNKILTDGKIIQFKKNKNIDEAIIAYKNSLGELNDGIDYNLNKAKKLVADLKEKINSEL